VPSPTFSSGFAALVTRIAADDRAALRILYCALCGPIGDQLAPTLPGSADVRAVVEATFVEV
jgi:hypothetical protein